MKLILKPGADYTTFKETFVTSETKTLEAAINARWARVDALAAKHRMCLQMKHLRDESETGEEKEPMKVQQETGGGRHTHSAAHGR